MNKGIVAAIASSIILFGIFFFYFHNQQVKIAHVRSLDLVYGYEGTSKAKLEFDKMVTINQAKLDSLMANRRKFEELLANAKDENEKKEFANIIEVYKHNAAVLQEEITKQIAADDQHMTQTILNRINTEVESYAKENNIKYVLGSTSEGSLLFGDDQFDITEDILKRLNSNE